MSIPRANGEAGERGAANSSARLSFTSRERVEFALGHKQADRVPLDLGGGPTTGIHVSALYRIRQAFGLDAPGTPVRVIEPFQMLGEVAPDLIDALGVDVVGVGIPTNLFGFANQDWKPWVTFDGTPVLVPRGFNTDTSADPDGGVLMYPQGDTLAPPSARMPRSGLYFDAVERQQLVDDEHLDVEDNLEEFGSIAPEDLDHLTREVARLIPTGRAILGNFGGTGFGDIALVPGMNLKHPKGIRDIEEWYVSLSLRPAYIAEVFDRQWDIGLQNLARIYEAVGDAITAVFVTGTDFGGQQGPLISPRCYRNLFMPVHCRVNDWIHSHTRWKTFVHSCGSIGHLLDDIVEAGFDALNPVQTSAAHMDPTTLKMKYGDRITFWGGGIDTQHVLPFGTPSDVRNMVRDRMRLFGQGGGFVFSAVHNVQAGVTVENLLALCEAISEFRGYPLE